MRREHPEPRVSAMQHPVRHRWPLWPLALVLVLVLPAASCSGDAGDDYDVPGVYIAVIRALAPDASTTMPKVIYVDALPGTQLSLQDQAAVVNAFGDGTEVRFIDDRQEAVDPDGEQAPVRREGVLLQMNPAQTTDHGVSIKTTRYVTRGDEYTTCLELEEQAQVWSVASRHDC